MNNPTSNKREQWSSKFGFIMSAAGSAVGLGNIWKFPYICGTNGGALFLIFYIAFVILLGYPILMTELAIGRNGEQNAVESCKKIHPKFGIAGGLGIAGSFAVLSYYCVVGGWVMKYLFACISGSIPESDYFSDYAAQTVEPIIWLCIFLIINALIVISGVSKGIERVSSILLPLLLIFLFGIMIYSLSLPNAMTGVEFFLYPDFSAINGFSDIVSIAVKALGQVFFSLSLGMGTLITYGSYLSRSTDLRKSTATIVIIDTIIAVISGLTILPAVFSMGLEPDEGAGLIFSTLTAVFNNLKGGTILAAVFFALVLFAAITSAISLMEVIAAFLSERYKLSRKAAVWLPVIPIALICIAASLSFGGLSDFTIMGMNIFDLLIFISDQIIMPIGGFCLCILAGWLWKKEDMKKELTSDSKFPFRMYSAFRFMIRYLSPAMIIIVFISSFIMF